MENRVAIVTGGGRGIGEGIALTLAEAGADVVVVARTLEQVELVTQKIRQLGRKSLAISADVTDEEQIQNMTNRALAEFEKIDILVNNAGLTYIKPLVVPPGFESSMARLIPDFYSPMKKEEWDKVFDTNLTSIFICVKAVGPHMISRGQGKIINISSLGSVRGSAYRIAYTASKAAVSMFTKSLALEWAKYNINVNAIAPGSVSTALTAWLHDDKKGRENLIHSIPLRRLGEPRDIGLLAVYLASDASSYVTGQTILIAGGSDL